MSKFKTYYFPLTIIAILFFVFGFITWVNGILIPYFQICLELTNFESTWVAFAAYIAYFVMAIPSAWILKYTGYKNGMVLGLVVMAIGTILFVPAAYTRTYSLFLTGLFITGSGLALLQTAANPYVAIIGPIESNAQRIGFMGIANKTAGILSQFILGGIFLFNADAIVKEVSKAGAASKAVILDTYALRIVNPYIIITIILLVLSVLIYFSKMPEVNEQPQTAGKANVTTRTSIRHYPYLIFGILALFVSNACEVIPIDGIILYSRSLDIPIEQARHFTSYTLYAMLGGYIASTILIPKYLSQQKALAYCSVSGIVLTLGAYFSDGVLSVYCLTAMGFGAALLWGTIWGLSLRELGRFTKTGSALLLMSVIGGGIFPMIFGRLLDVNPAYPQVAVLLLIPCYVILFFFSTWGYRVNTWKTFAINKVKPA